LIFVNMYTSGMTRLSTAQAAKRLGVKASTIYAYVSRGILNSEPSSDGRSSTFSASEIEAIALRGKPRQASRSHALDFTIDTSITSITQTHLRYRGFDAVELATSRTFEQVADLLLTGVLPEHQPWPIRAVEVTPGLSVFDHFSLATILTASSDPIRHDLGRLSVSNIARALISSIVGSWPSLGDGRTPRLRVEDGFHRSTIAGQLWTRLSSKRPAAGMVEILNASLVLLADHELAVSTVAARVTASTRADPYAVISAAIAAISGPLHGGASRPARRMLDQAIVHSRIQTGVRSSGSSTQRTTLGAERAAGEALSQHGMYPGFGHKVYKEGDPRADALLRLLREVAGGSEAMNAVDGVIAAVARRRDLRPNIDLALAAFGMIGRFPESSAEQIFTLARIAGWSAHANEEYAEAPLRFRARAIYFPSRDQGFGA
jgi:citrate synthase